MLTADSRSQDFPSLLDRTYLNSAAESIPPLSVQKALQTYAEHKAMGMAGRDYHFAEVEACRNLAATMLKKSPGEVSFCSCSSEAYNLLASALQLEGEDEVVISDLDFPAGATPWLRSPRSPTVNLWKNQNGVLDLDDLRPLLSENTKLVQVSLVSFLTGYRIPWAPFRDLVRELAPQAVISVDVTQCFGRVELDCLDADCLISSTHKWLLGMHGGCVVAIPEHKAEQITTRAGGWYHIENAFDSDRFERATSKTGAHSFSVGMPNFAAIYALRAGMDYLQKIGITDIAEHADALIAKLHQNLSDIGIQPMAPPQPSAPSGIISFQHQRDEEVNRDLLSENIHVMHQAGRLRISVHGYNTAGEIDKLTTVLKKWA